MGHHAQNISRLIADGGDALRAAVDIIGELIYDPAVFVAVAEYHLIIFIKLFDQTRGGGDQIALAMGDGDLEQGSPLNGKGAGRPSGRGLMPEVDPVAVVAPADDLSFRDHHILGQGHIYAFIWGALSRPAGKQARLHQNLKSVADANDRLALACLILESSQHRLLGGNGPGTQPVLIGEASRQDKAIKAG